MVVELPLHGRYFQTFVLGPHVLFMIHDWRDDAEEDYRVLAYDFSRWGCRALVEERKRRRILMPNPGETWSLRKYRDTIESVRALGDGLVSCGVSYSLEPLKHIEGLYLARGECRVPE